MINLYAGWISILAGCIAGAVAGLFFGREKWLGGYDSWPRRMTRLGHISFFGIGFINLAFALSAASLGVEDQVQITSVLLIVAVITMPLLCYLSAFVRTFRHLFFIPAGSVMFAIAIFLWEVFSK